MRKSLASGKAASGGYAAAWASTAWQTPGCGTKTLPTAFQRGLFVNPHGFTVGTRVQVEESGWSSSALSGFTARGVDSYGEHWHSSPAAWLTFPYYPGTEVLSKDIETTGKWIFPCSLHSW